MDYHPTKRKPGEPLHVYLLREAEHKTKCRNAVLRAERAVLEEKIKEPPACWKADADVVNSDHELRHPKH